MGKWVVLPSTRGYITEGTHGYEGLWAVYGGTVVGYCGVLGVTAGYPAVFTVIPVPCSALQGRIVLMLLNLF